MSKLTATLKTLEKKGKLRLADPHRILIPISDEMELSLYVEEGRSALKGCVSIVFGLDPVGIPRLFQATSATFVHLSKIPFSPEPTARLKELSGEFFGWVPFTPENLEQLLRFAEENVVPVFLRIRTRKAFLDEVMHGRHDFIRFNGDRGPMNYYFGYCAKLDGDNAEAARYFLEVAQDPIEQRRDSFVLKQAQIELSTLRS